MLVICDPGSLTGGSTAWAQGGIAAVLDAGDTFENHIRDTMVAGAGLNDRETVEFVITNSGALTHEFVVTNQEEIDEHLEAGHEEGHDEGEEGHEGAPLEVEIEPGETGTLVVTFDEPDHKARFACLIEGHYEAGMHGDFDLSG